MKILKKVKLTQEIQLKTLNNLIKGLGIKLPSPLTIIKTLP